jgi:membrane protein required for colicin V production
MTIYDAAMAGLVLAGMIWGAWRGIVWQAASIASLVLGYTLAHPLSAQLAPRFPGDPVVARALAMLAVYVAVAAGVFLAGWMVRATLRQWKFEAFDRHLGMVFGGLEGALLGLIATLFVVSLAPQTRTSIFASPSGRIVGRVMDLVGPVLPGEARQALAPFWAAERGTPAASFAGGKGLHLPLPSSRAASASPSPSSAAASLENWVEDGETRVGRAIAETAEQELRKASESRR